jgi:hypothetical protein
MGMSNTPAKESSRKSVKFRIEVREERCTVETVEINLNVANYLRVIWSVACDV